MFVRAAVRLMTGRASLHRSGLVQMRLLHLLRLIAVASEACANRIGLYEARTLSAMRVVERDALSRRARMLHLRRFDRLALFFMAGQAERSAVRVDWDHLAVLCRLMAAVAHLAVEGHMQERLHQLRLRRFMWVVALQAVRSSERLPLMRLCESFVFRIVAVEAQRGNRLLQMRRKLELAAVAILVRHVARVASHIKSGVAAALFRNIYTDLVAG